MKTYYCYYVLHPESVVWVGKFIKARSPEQAKEKLTRYMIKTGLIMMSEYVRLEVEEV